MSDKYHLVLMIIFFAEKKALFFFETAVCETKSFCEVASADNDLWAILPHFLVSVKYLSSQRFF